MGKEVIPQKYGIVLMVTFLLGSTLVLGAGSNAKHDSWIAILLSMLLALPIFFVYCRLIIISAGKSLFSILEYAYGKILGKVVIILYSWYAFHLGALVVRNFVEFITIVSLPETPKFIIGIFMIVVCIWGVKAGIEVLGRWTAIILPVIFVTLGVVTLLTIPLFNPENLKPVLGNGLGPVLKGAFSVFSFPFAESVILIPMLANMRSRSSPYKVYYLSLLISGSIILMISVRSVVVLGVPSVMATYFSSYDTVSLINVGDFIQRIEVTVSIIFMFAGFIKICVCLYTACQGFVKLLKIDNYTKMAAPVGLLMFIFALTLYVNTMEMFDWADKIYPYYAIPFQVILPVITLAAAEIRRHISKKTKPIQPDQQ